MGYEPISHRVARKAMLGLLQERVGSGATDVGCPCMGSGRCEMIANTAYGFSAERPWLLFANEVYWSGGGGGAGEGGE